MQFNEDISQGRDKMLELNKSDKFISWLGIEFIEFENDYIVTKMPVRDEFLNNFGAIHGGILYSLADITAGTLSCAYGKFTPTVDGHLNYLEAALVKEYVTCHAKCMRCGNHLVSMNVEIKNEEGKLLDDGCFTFYRSNKHVI